MRTCIFCGSRATSKEHVFSSWLIEALSNGSQRTEITLSIAGETLTPWAETGPERGLKVRSVCRRCNNNWMSELEETVKPYLLAMLRDFSLPLDREAQILIATWTVKLAMVLEGVRPTVKFYTDSSRRVLMEQRQPPDGTMVWLGCGAYAGRSVALGRSIGFSADGPVLAGAAMTMCFGHVVLQVLAATLKPEHKDFQGRMNVNFPNIPDPWRGRLSVVWPPQNRTVDWPPVRSAVADEAEAVQLSKRFENF